MSLGFRNLGQLGLGGGNFFQPTALFSAGEQGVWFDPSDLSTMFQDVAGDTPAVVGAVVGLHLDKSKGRALGAELLAGLVGVPGLQGAATAATYNSVTGVGSITAVDGSNYSYLNFNGLTTGWYKITFTNDGPGNFLGIRDGGPGGTVWGSANSGQTKTQYIRISGTTMCFRLAIAGTATFTITSLKMVAGNHRSQPTSASRPILRQSGSLSYLEYDGVDDFMQTIPIDFSASDKITVWAGVRKGSDAAVATFLELSTDLTSNAGSFGVFAPVSAGVGNYRFHSRGTAAGGTGATAATFTAPITNVLTCQSDIAADSQIIRVNGVQAANSVADQGAGNFGSYPLYFGRRGGTSLPFNGYEYGLIVRGGPQDPSLTNRTEAWMNGKTGAY